MSGGRELSGKQDAVDGCGGGNKAARCGAHGNLIMTIINNQSASNFITWLRTTRKKTLAETVSGREGNYWNRNRSVIDNTYVQKLKMKYD